MIYRTTNGAIFNDWPTLPPVSRSLYSLTLNLRNGTRYRHSFNGILIGTDTRPTQQCHRMTSSDLDRSVARSLCDELLVCWVWQCTWPVAEMSHLRQRTLRRPKLRSFVSTSAPHTSSRQPIFHTLACRLSVEGRTR